MAVEMKDTGIEWIGKIPKEWDVNKIKYSAILKGRIGWQGLTTAEYRDEGPFLITGIDFADGSIDWEHCEHVELERWAEDPYIQITNGDLLITKDGTVGKTAIVEGLNDKATLNSGVLLIRTDETCNRKYLYWILNSQLFWNWFNDINSGNSTIIHLYQGDFNNFIYPVPHINEQKKIANYLDKQTGKIDAIIKTNKEQLEVLKKYKKTLITKIITKGLEKKNKIKKSGVEWIDNICETYDVIKLKYLLTGIADGTHGTFDRVDENGKLLLSAKNVFEEGLIINDNESYISEKDCKEILKIGYPKKGDILMCIVGTIGRCCVFDSKEPIAFQRSVAFLRCNNLVYNRYLMYGLRTSFIEIEESFLQRGTAQAGLYLSNVLDLHMIVPPTIEEQKQISDYLDKECTKIDMLISKKQQAIDTMQKYKKSLIYEYVTGKKRIK